jgi:hypothetical protein
MEPTSSQPPPGQRTLSGVNRFSARAVVHLVEVIMFVSLHSTPRALGAFTLVCGLFVAETSAFAQTAPIGWVDVADWHHIAGWASDADINPSYNYPSSCGVQSTGGIVVHAYVWPVDENNNITGSARVFGAMSNQCRCDVSAAATSRVTASTSPFPQGLTSSFPGAT